jgi:hypothetical protein
VPPPPPSVLLSFLPPVLIFLGASVTTGEDAPLPNSTAIFERGKNEWIIMMRIIR